MLEGTLSGVRMELAATQAANATLSQENAHLENHLRCAKFGAENIGDDDAKTPVCQHSPCLSHYLIC